MVELKPMELGEIVDRSAAFWRVHWKRLYGLFFAFNMAQYALVKGGQALLGRWSPALRDLPDVLRLANTDPAEFQRQAPAAIAGFTAVFGVMLFATFFATTAAARYVMPAFLGQGASISDGLRRALGRFSTIAGLYTLAIAWSVVVLVPFVAPGVLLSFSAGLVLSQPALAFGLIALGTVTLGFGMLAWALWFFLRFALWAPVAAMEEGGALAAFHRCGALTSGRVGPGLLGLVKVRLMILITVVGLVLMLITLISGAPVLVLRGVYGEGQAPSYLLVPAELLNAAVNSVVYPLYVAFQVIFYVDMRVRREGLDLELKLQAAAA
jgi:hypothetical protein